jgi:hypothetical protein
MHGNASIAAPLLTGPFPVIAERVWLPENLKPLTRAKQIEPISGSGIRARRETVVSVAIFHRFISLKALNADFLLPLTTVI